METYEQAIAECMRLGRPATDAYALNIRFSGLVAMVGLPPKTATMSALLRQMTAATGLDQWERLDPTLPPRDRIMRVLELAKARWQALPENDRLFEPLAALRELTVALRPETIRHAGTYRAEHPDGTVVRMSCYTGEYPGTLAASSEIDELAWFRYADRPRVPPVDQLLFDDLNASGQLR